MSKLDYIFCLPGHPSSGIQAHHALISQFKLFNTGKRIAWQCAFSSDVYSVRNLCLQMLEQRSDFRRNQQVFNGEYDYDRIIWLDSDNIVTYEQLQRLIDHDVDIVGGWYRVYRGDKVEDIDDSNIVACGYGDIRPMGDGDSGNFAVRPFTVGEMKALAQQDKLLEVDNTGFGCLVVKKGVFESLEFPWFQAFSFDWEKGGELFCRNVTEDIGWCLRVRGLGYKIWIDPKVNVGHEKRVVL